MNGSSNGDHDADLADLVDDDRRGQGLEFEMAPLNGRGDGKPPPGRASTATMSVLEQAGMLKPGGPSAMDGTHYGDFQFNCCSSPFVSLLCAYFAYTCEYAPRVCWTIGAAMLLIPTYLLVVGVLANPTEHFGVISHDYSNIQSQYDFQIKDIDHWCLKGDNDSCQCEDPLQPTPRNHIQIWSRAHAANVEMVNKMVEEEMASPDIVFLGGTVVETMEGKWWGTVDPRLQNVAAIFDSHFNKLEGGATDEDALTAVSLGIPGDTSPTVLWRVLNGEMPKDLNPKLWWLELGLNDLGRAQCSEEVVILGVLRVVEEILNQKPDAKIVINSLFPMAELRGFGIPSQQQWASRTRLPPKGGVARPLTPNLPASAVPPNPGGTKQGRPSNEVPTNGRDDVSPPKDNNMIKRPNANGNRTRRRVKGRRLRRGDPSDDDVFHDRGSVNKRGPIKLNPNKKAQHKFNIVTHRENKVPLWTSIMAVNRELKRFCAHHDRVFFHDVTNIFTEQGRKFYTLNTDMITLRGLPTEAGFDAWETSIVIRAKYLLQEDS